MLYPHLDWQKWLEGQQVSHHRCCCLRWSHHPHPWKCRECCRCVCAGELFLLPLLQPSGSQNSHESRMQSDSEEDLTSRDRMLPSNSVRSRTEGRHGSHSFTGKAAQAAHLLLLPPRPGTDGGRPSWPRPRLLQRSGRRLEAHSTLHSPEGQPAETKRRHFQTG